MSEPEWTPQTGPELALYLILVNPELKDRLHYLRDFCAVYEIREKSHSNLAPVEKMRQLQGSI